MENRFAQKVEHEAKMEESGKAFFDSATELAKEIAEKGIRGVELTEAEHRFMKDMTMFMLRGLIGKGV